MNQFIQIFLMTLTVVMEAGEQSYKGKLAVAWVLHRRQGIFQDKSLSDVEFRAYQFTAWLTGSATLMNIDQIPDAQFFECLKACIAAVYGLEADPTGGAVFYLNPKLTRQQNHGQLPNWWDIDGDPFSEVVIGDHAFRRKRGM